MPKRKIRKTRNRTFKKQAIENSSKVKMEWRVCPYLDFIERPKGGCFIFNELRFSPIRTEASLQEVKSLINKVRQQGTSHLTKDAIDFLVSHGILVPKNGSVIPPSQWPLTEWQNILNKAPFTIRLNAGIISIKMVLHSLETVIRYIRKSCEDSVLPHLMVKFIFNDHPCQAWSEHFIQVYQFLIRQIGDTKNISFQIECPIEFVSTNVDQLLFFSRPSIHINCIVSKPLSETSISVLKRLVNEGFRPNLIFQVFKTNFTKIFEDIEKCGTIFGHDGFSFRLMPVAYNSSCAKESAQLDSICSNDLLSLLDSCHSLSQVELSQSWLYTDLKERITNRTIFNPFPCNAYAGRAVFVDGDGTYSVCHKQAMNGSKEKQKELAKVLQKPTEGCFGLSKFAIKQCRRCSFRYFCGGICDYIDAEVVDPVISQQLFQLHCDMRKHMLLHFYEDATSESERSEQYLQKYHLDGQLNLVSVEKEA